MSETLSGLTKEQAQEFNKYMKMKSFFDDTDNKVIYETYIPLNDEVEQFSANITDVENLLPKKITDNKGITTEKDYRKEVVAAHWYSNILSKSKAYAFKVHDRELAVKLGKSQSDIESMRDGDVYSFCLGVNGELTPILGEAAFMPYGVNAGVLAAGMVVANDFKEYIGKAKDENAKKTVAGGSIGLEFMELRDNNIQFRLLVENFKTSEPDFYNGFLAVDVEDDIGVRHTGIEGVITNKADGVPLRGVVIKNLTRNKAAKSNLTGDYALIKQVTGDCEIEVSAVGKKPIVFIMKMKRGKIIDMDFEMEDL